MELFLRMVGEGKLPNKQTINILMELLDEAGQFSKVGLSTSMPMSTLVDRCLWWTSHRYFFDGERRKLTASTVPPDRVALTSLSVSSFSEEQARTLSSIGRSVANRSKKMMATNLPSTVARSQSPHPPPPRPPSLPTFTVVSLVPPIRVAAAGCLYLRGDFREAAGGELGPVGRGRGEPARLLAGRGQGGHPVGLVEGLAEVPRGW